MAIETWRANTLAKTLATLAGTTRFRVVTDPTGTPVSQQTSLDAVKTWLGSRDKLTANRTYYVRADGSDSNTGLANTAAGAFLTIQKAINVVSGLDLGVYSVAISIGAGTFSENLVLLPIVGSGSV